MADAKDDKVEWLAFKACSDKLCTGMKQAKNALCQKFYAKQLLSDSLNSKCFNGTEPEKFMMEMVDALEKRVAIDSQAYYTILEVLQATQGVQYLEDLLEKEREKVLNKQKSTEQPKKTRNSQSQEYEDLSSLRDPPSELTQGSSNMSSQEKYSDTDKQHAPLGQATYNDTANDRDAQLLQLPKVSSSLVINGSKTDTFAVETEGTSLSIMGTISLAKPDEKQPDEKQPDKRAHILAGEESQDSCTKDTKRTGRKVSSTMKCHHRSHSFSSSWSDSSEAYQSVSSSPTKIKTTAKGERKSLPYCCRKQVKIVEKKYAILIETNQHFESLFQKTIEELRELKIQCEDSEKQKSELHGRLAEYQRDEAIFKSTLENMERELQNEKARVKFLLDELDTEEADKEEEIIEKLQIQDKLETEVHNERAKTEKIRKEKEKERKLRRRLQLEAIGTNKKQQEETIPTSGEVPTQPEVVQCQDQDEDHTRQTNRPHYLAEPQRTQGGSNYFGICEDSPVSDAGCHTIQETCQDSQDTGPLMEQNQLGQQSKLV